MFDTRSRRAAVVRAAETIAGRAPIDDDAEHDVRRQALETTLSGMVTGTRVATAVGWQKIETLRAGDAVLTFDNGLKTLRGLSRRAIWDGDSSWPEMFQPLLVPERAIGNREEMLLMPRQGVVVESDVAEHELGDPFVLLRAESLDGICGITRHQPVPEPEVFILEFDEDEVIFASSGALCICPAAGDLIGRAISEEQLLGEKPEYRILGKETASDLIDAILWELEEKWIEGQSSDNSGQQSAAS